MSASIDELKICALLYSTPNSILFPLQVILNLSSKYFIDLGSPRMVWNTILGTWHRKPICTVQRDIIESLAAKGLIQLQEEYGQKFYTLNTQEKHKEFFQELEMQIALGSI